MTIAIITPQHRQRGGQHSSLARRKHHDPDACRRCGKKPPDVRFYTRKRDGKRLQPCAQCHKDAEQARKISGTSKVSANNLRNPNSPTYAAPGTKQVTCPFPGCRWAGSYLALSKHRKEHER